MANCPELNKQEHTTLCAALEAAMNVSPSPGAPGSPSSHLQEALPFIVAAAQLPKAIQLLSRADQVVDILCAVSRGPTGNPILLVVRLLMLLLLGLLLGLLLLLLLLYTCPPVLLFLFLLLLLLLLLDLTAAAVAAIPCCWAPSSTVLAASEVFIPAAAPVKLL